MKPCVAPRPTAALTLVEVLVVVFILIILVLTFLPDTHHAKLKPQRIECANNLKQIGLSFRLWEGDHGDKYPMEISITNGGTREWAAIGDVTSTFQVMSNELDTPKLLCCQADTNRTFAANFQTMISVKNLSYFVGVDASESDPQALLSGDDNFEVGGVPVESGRLELPTNAPITWSADRHRFSGNIALADGSVQSVTNSVLTKILHQTGFVTNRLAIP